MPDSWAGLGPQVVGDGKQARLSYSGGGKRSPRQFYRVNQVNLAPFDDDGFAFAGVAPPDLGGDLTTLTVSVSGGPTNLDILPTSLTFAGRALNISAANDSRPSQKEITFDFPIDDLTPGDYSLSLTYANEPSQTGVYTVPANILFMIFDDWGHDASPVDNATPGVYLANMPNLKGLVEEGLRFTRAYSQPTCSPMRATMLTGRQVYQHNVGDPQDANQFSRGQDEITLPEIFATMGAPHKLLSVGKWHLGGGDSGYRTRGGWPEFYGINAGGVQDYLSWSKNSNGS
ncbi:MAG: sulfatase-like hydrolase/transferase, partial [Opitutae bacterium]|nr:sulfatase-like hydrolase/transferase [Opitutae bacterium]